MKWKCWSVRYVDELGMKQDDTWVADRDFVSRWFKENRPNCKRIRIDSKPL